MKRIFYLVLALFIFSAASNVVAQTAGKDGKEWTTHDAKKWFKKKEWLGGLQLKPHKTINKREFARQYHVNKAYWDKAFAFLKEQDIRSLANGRYPIDGENVFAIVTQNPTKDLDSTQWESHRNYIDLHYVVSGQEKMGVYPITKLTVAKPYDATKDIANYSGKGKIYTAVPGVFFLFFPSDGHRPNITTGGNKADKKIVIKVRYAD